MEACTCGGAARMTTRWEQSEPRDKEQNLHKQEPLTINILGTMHHNGSMARAEIRSMDNKAAGAAACAESCMSEAMGPVAVSCDTRKNEHEIVDVCQCPTEEVSTPPHHQSKPSKLFSVLRAVACMFPVAPHIACKHLAMPPGHAHRVALGSRVMTGTLFGHRKCHVRFSIQQDPKSHPLLLLELATPTNTLVKDMASGLVRIALECERTQNRGKLFSEPVWTMYCNGKKTGYAKRRACSETDLHVLGVVQAVSMGAGVLPMQEEGPDGELMYMRARFERVIGCKDSEAFYMMNPDGTGGPELSIFLLRI